MWRFLFAALTLFPNTISASNAYLPLTPAELARSFPLKAFPFGYPYVRKLGPTSISINHAAETVHFRGIDKSGKAWSVHVHSSTIGRLFQADLDANGELDLIYISSTGAAGAAPGQRIVFLCFDRSGRPVPAEFEGDIDFSERGIGDILDLDGNGHAEFLRQEIDDGYWITSLYEFRDSRIHLVRTPHAGRTYPLYTRYTARPNKIALTPKPPRHPRQSDLSNSSSNPSPIRLSGFQFDKTAMTLHLQPEEGQSYCVLQYQKTFMVTIDSPSARRSASIGAFSHFRPLLDEILRDRLPVYLAGRRYQHKQPLEDCVEAIWANQSN